MMHQYFRTRISTTSGAALIMSLVILLVLTVLGISAMKSAGQQENIVGNLRDHDLAFFAANSALAYAEGRLSTELTPPESNQQRSYGTIIPADAFNSVSEDLAGTAYNASIWGTPGNTTQYTTLYPKTLTGVAYPPSYIIQLIDRNCDGPNLKNKVHGHCTYVYRITTRGFGGTVNSRVLLQATYFLRGYG